MQHPLIWAVLYIVAVIGAPLMSRYRSIMAFGIVNLVGLILVAVFYAGFRFAVVRVRRDFLGPDAGAHGPERRQLPESDRARGGRVLV